MSRISWDTQDRSFETGVDQGVLYLDTGKGVPWNGLVSVEDAVDGGETEQYYMDGEKYLDVVNGEDTSLTMSAITYPEEFSDYDGYDDVLDKQGRRLFGFSYRTNKGEGHKIHIVYNCTAVPAEKTRTTEGDSTEPTAFSWNVVTVPALVPGAKPTAHIVIDTTEASATVVAQLEAMLYGSSDTNSSLPTPAAIVELFLRNATFIVIDHGDGSWTASGTDDIVYMTDNTSFEIDWPLAVFTDSTTYTIRSS